MGRGEGLCRYPLAKNKLTYERSTHGFPAPYPDPQLVEDLVGAATRGTARDSMVCVVMQRTTLLVHCLALDSRTFSWASLFQKTSDRRPRFVSVRHQAKERTV